MPLDTSIPLGVQVPQFGDAVDPATQRYNALRMQALQQEMARNQLIMQNTMQDRARAEADRARAAAQATASKNAVASALRGAVVPQAGEAPGPYMPDYNRSINMLASQGRLPEASTMSNLLEQMAKQREAEAKVPGAQAVSRKQGTEADTAEYDAAVSRLVPLVRMVKTGEDAASFTNAMYDDPVLGPKLDKIIPRAQAVARAPTEYAANPLAWMQSHMLTGKELADAMAKASGMTGAPDLKKGERWNPQEQRVEAVPGSDIYVQQSKAHGKDYGAINDLNTTTDFTTKTIDKILDPKNEDAFNSNFGLSSYVGGQYMPGKAQDLKADIETLKSQLKVAGLKLIRQGGSIGAMTEKEWPIVQNMIDTITPTMSEEKARDTLKEIQARVNAIRDTAKDTYDTTWGNSQYYKSEVGKKSAADADNKSVFDAADAILGGK